MSDPYEAIKSIYDEQLEKRDSSGYAVIYKRCSEDLISAIEASKDLHVSDVQYLDGYFVFAKGTNSVLHFHVDECPGWKFGVWYDAEEGQDPDEVVSVSFKFFAQYESEIDKFKPADTTLREDGTFQVLLKDSAVKHLKYVEIIKLIRYIEKEPELAFCRFYYWLDYNKSYVSREEAKKLFDKYFEDKKTFDECCSRLNGRILDYYYKNILPILRGAHIHDKGDNVSPRYDIVAPLSLYSDILIRPGSYSLKDVLGRIDLGAYLKLDEYCDEVFAEAENLGIVWYPCIDQVLRIYDDSEVM